MDPFTQKLLERTQARKEQLEMKRMELAACRSKRNGVSSPALPRQPLTENNADKSSTKEEESKPVKPARPALVPSSPVTKSPQMKVENTNQVTKNKCTPSDNKKRARIFSDPASPASTKTKQGVDMARQRILSDGSVPTSQAASRFRVKAEIESESPSIEARRQRLLEMQKKDSEVTPKKHWKKALNMNPDDSPSVAARSAAFLGKVQQDETTKKVDGTQNINTLTPVTGKLAEARNIFEKGASGDIITKSEGRPAKLHLVGPPKPPRVGDVNTPIKVEKHTTKRKAPAPPNDRNGEKSKSSCSSDSDSSDIIVTKATETVPTKKPVTGRGVESRAQIKLKPALKDNDHEIHEIKPRKRSQDSGNGADAKAEIDAKDERERKREERKKARMEKKEISKPQTGSGDEEVIQACAIAEGNSYRRYREKQVNSVKAVAVDCSVKRVPTLEDIPQKSVKVLSIGSAVCPSKKVDESQEVCDAILQAVSDEDDQEKIKKSAPKSSFRKHKKQESESMVSQHGPFRLQGSENKGVSSSEEGESPSELDETVNLNDVNIHEMTFTFDFSNFDKIEEERESKFQKSFNEKCQELKKDEPTSGKSSRDRKVDEERPKETFEKTDMGTFTSGYQATTEDQYATKALSKAKPPVPERPKATHDRLKELLDQAASQQNIVLQMSQALNVCAASQDIFGGSQEEIEAERVLLLAAERKQACLNEHQRLKSRPHESMRGRGRGGLGQPCAATVSLSGIQLSLKQDFMDMLRVGIRQDLGVFHFVIHVQNGPMEINSSKTLSTHDCTEGNTLTFPDTFILKDLDPKFAVYVKVFGMNVQKRFPSTLTPNQKQKLFQSPKVAKHKDSPAALPVFRNPNFKLVGVARITLTSVNAKKFGLEYVPQGCPLNNHIRLKARCTPQYKCLVKGFLTILEDIGGYNAWQRRWCVLEGGMLSQWRYPGDETTKPPLGSLDLGQCVSSQVTTVSRDLCARPHTMEVVFKKGDEDVRYLLACDTKADKVTWLDSLNEALKDFKAWSVCHTKALYPELGSLEEKPKGSKPHRDESAREQASLV